MAITIKSIPILKEKAATEFIKKADTSFSERASVSFSKQLVSAYTILKKAKMH